jgi:male-specific lethal 1
MISYNSGSRDLCIKIKNELEKLNLKVWIDINEIHNSSIESMSLAVEQAACVLMCVTEKYKQSINCQAEAQYAFRLNKIIIPLIMQPGFHNVTGWLGFIIGDKIFVDFIKYKFEVAIEKLLIQIKLNEILNSSLDEILEPNEKETNNLQVNLKINNDSNPKLWNEEQVKNWFKSNNITFHDLDGIDGSVLFEMYEMKRSIPEFFFKSISRNNNLSELKNIALLSSQLGKLF